MRTFFSLIGAGLVFAALSGAVLSWDGSVYLFNVLNEQQPFAANDRFINVLLHWPVVLGSRLTSNIVVLQTLLGLMYVTIPLTALALCWWVVRDGARELFVWPALAIGLGMLPGIFQFVAEANIVVFLFWPVVLAIVLSTLR